MNANAIDVVEYDRVIWEVVRRRAHGENVQVTLVEDAPYRYRLKIVPPCEHKDPDNFGRRKWCHECGAVKQMWGDKWGQWVLPVYAKDGREH